MPSSITEAAQLIRNRSISSAELTREALERAEKLNPILNAFITITTDLAMEQARQADAEIQRGEDRGPLHGIPLGLKDLIDTAGVRTTAASELFKDRIPAQDAHVVWRLKRAGAILIGKQNLHEFAYGGSSLVSYYGDIRNAWNSAHIAGGSSGGSATAVAAGIGFAAIGTDTAGSVREPAAQCGVVGLKPTYGKVSARGVLPLSPSLDHVGPIACTVPDLALLFEAIGNVHPSEMFDQAKPAKILRIGVPRHFFFDDLDPEVASAVEEALAVLSALGHQVRDVELEVPIDRRLQMAESYASHKQYVTKVPEHYQQETLRRILTGQNISDDEVATKLFELHQIRHDTAKLFDACDVLVTATTPMPAPLIADLKASPDQLRPAEIRLLRNTRPFNVWGLPAISVPCGFTKAGLPIGLQIAGPNDGEAVILQLAYSYEQATDWHKARPAIYEG